MKLKLLVLSDSHGSMRVMEEAVMTERPDLIVHLGDRIRDAERLGEMFPQIPMLGVPGNCDYPAPGAELTLLRSIGGVTILMTHGHLYHVKQSLLAAELAAREAGAQVLLFGHTHRTYCLERDGLWMLNPGSCGYSRSYGLVNIEGGRTVCRLAEIQDGG